MWLDISQGLQLPAFQEVILSLGKWDFQVNFSSDATFGCHIHPIASLFPSASSFH